MCVANPCRLPCPAPVTSHPVSPVFAFSSTIGFEVCAERATDRVPSPHTEAKQTAKPRDGRVRRTHRIAKVRIRQSFKQRTAGSVKSSQERTRHDVARGEGVEPVSYLAICD